MKSSESGNRAAVIALSFVLAVSLIFHVMQSTLHERYADQGSKQTNKSSRAHCDAQLRALGYDPPPIKASSETGAKPDDQYDLCQQIRAAEAADDAAWYAKWQWIVACAGTGLVFVATIVAGFAARYTWGQANVAKKALSAQSRAWLSEQCRLGAPKEGRTYLGEEGVWIEFYCRSENHGNSPATKVRFAAHIAIPTDEGEAARKWLQAISSAAREQRGIEASVFPRGSSEFSTMLFLSAADIRRSTDMGVIVPLIVGCIVYETPHVEGDCETRFSYHAGTVRDDGHAVVIKPDDPDWLEKPWRLLDPHFTECS